MNIIYFFLPWQFTFFTNSLSSTVSLCRISDSEGLHFSISSNEDGGSTSAILKSTDQKLANENLPIWTVHRDDPDTMHQEKHVMREIGPFIMYRDQVTSTAVVFFHKRLQFVIEYLIDNTNYELSVPDGIADSRYIIEGLYWNPEAISHKEPHTFSVIRRETSRFYTDIIPESNSIVSVYLQNVSRYNEESKKGSGGKRSRQDVRNTVYIETLVFVNYDVVEEFQNDDYEYTSIVSYILTLFNNVDMLFSKVNDPIIKFNIAGIIIGSSRESFPLYMGGECHEQIENNEEELVASMNVRCVNKFMRSFCNKHARTIPPGTYDIVVILTRYGLHHYQYDQRTGDRSLKRVGGAAESPTTGYYELMRAGTMPVLVAAVSDRGEYESFAVLAHEIAHLFTVEHDEPSGEKFKLMQPNGKYDSKSLSWSRASTESLRIFFESSDSCIFRNKPTSLYPQGPREILDADQQCKCYGYKSAKTNIIKRIKGQIVGNCDDNIQCKDKNGQINDGPIFMDGTPCKRGKICWAAECIGIKKKNSCSYNNYGVRSV